ncbi:MAG TPA: alpha/beta hydrolase domain-containing protein [Candidatus Binatia bacterium]|nr:alpha/beta hydrolase domain-containing protein [Candidatus Binatia bacterium]
MRGLVLVGGANASVPVPTVSGPISSPGAAFITPPSSLDLTAAGYVEEEYFVEGTASAYSAAGAFLSDGRWAATPASTAPYKTRILVRRPTSPRKFNGVVIVEWLNVSGGVDAAPDWTFAHTLLLRKGYAWVGVSAQFVGVEGGSSPLGLDLSLKAVNPARYGSLSHPGDSFSYDMFSQAGEAIEHPSGVSPLGTLRPHRVIAIGESQSAARLVTYVNAVHPLARVYDGFLIHSRGGGGTPLSQPPQASVGTPSPSFVRDDLGEPVLIFETETDLITLGYLAARQPDGGNVRTWEVAGTAHDDAYGLAVGPDDPGPAALDTTYLPPVTSIFGVFTCAKPVNAGPQHYVLSAAVDRLTTWVRKGRIRGRSAPRLDIVAGPPPSIARDARGNALGGIRTPQLDVPIATLSGLGQPPGGFCAIFGTTVPFDAATLSMLYPSHTEYVTAVAKAAGEAVRARHLLRADVPAIKAAAIASNVGG